jgi:FKBP-type peptidyl-prolyl cis-trans isomerase FkpA
MRFAAVVLSIALASTVGAEGPTPELKTDDDKALYALGWIISQNLAAYYLSPSELAIVSAGLNDGVLGRKSPIEIGTYAQKAQELARSRAGKAAAEEKKKAEPFLAKAAAEKSAQKTSSGLVYQELKAGSGDAPKETDKVKVHYHGTLPDGTVFDSSVKRGQPATFPLNGVIPCWTEGVQKMKVGGKAKLVCPSDIAYGDRGSPPNIKPGAALVFEVELLEIVK